jgi:cbb3-type cytochrome oxidase maturation protein
MSVILLLIIASLSLALAFLAGFIWAVKTGQFEDTYTPSMRILLDEQKEHPAGGRPVVRLGSLAPEKFLVTPQGVSRPEVGAPGDTALNKSNT